MGMPQRKDFSNTSAMAMHCRAQELRCSTKAMSISPASSVNFTARSSSNVHPFAPQPVVIASFHTSATFLFRECPKELCRLPKWGHGKVKRLLGTGAGLIFKGSGFYTTDYRSDSYKEAAKKESPSKTAEAGEKSSATKESAKPSSPAESKPAEKKSAKESGA